MNNNPKKNVLVLPGDGIGPECVDEAIKIIELFNSKNMTNIDINHDYVGGSSFDIYKKCITENTLQKAKNADAILFGSVGGPKWSKVPRIERPENGLLKIRKELDLYANLRPAFTFPSLVNASSIKADLISGLDIMIIRELTSGVYFGEPKEIKSMRDGTKLAVDTQSYTSVEIERVARTAFEIAQQRQGKVCSVEKSNVMETGVLWREIVTELHAKFFRDIELTHMLADACSMELLRKPKQFDTIVTDNLFGDMLSDQSAMLTGSIGMLPSASLGVKNNDFMHALYEPIHGSAPDIAGKGLANPIAQILSLGMMLEYSFNLINEARLINSSIANCLQKNLRTSDVAEKNSKILSTKEMGDAILGELKNLIN